MSRNEKIASLYVDGQNLREIATQYGLSGERVRQILKAAGVPRRSRSPWTPEARSKAGGVRAIQVRFRLLEADPVRNDALADAVKGGLSFGQAARSFGVSRGTVAGVVHRAKLRAGACR